MLKSYQWNGTWTLQLFSVRETKWLSVFTEYFPQEIRLTLHNLKKLWKAERSAAILCKRHSNAINEMELDFWNFENWNEVPGKASNSAIFRNWQIK